MDIQKIKELALANGFKLKEQASGNMDLNAYVYDFANAIEREVKAQAVPEGFVVASTKDLNIIYDQINDWNTDWPLVFELFNRILEAQEPAND